MNKATKNMVMAAILTALSLLITYSPVKLVLPAFSLTLGSHVPTMLAMFISPWVTIMTIIGSCIGFFFVIPAPNNLIVVARAALHIIFALSGYYMVKSKKVNIFVIIVVTALLHAAAEGLAVYLMTPIILPENASASLGLAEVAFVGTVVHHFIDCAITAPVLAALMKAKMIHTDIQWKAMPGVRGVER